MVNRTDLSDEIEYWTLIEGIERYKVGITLNDSKNIPGDRGVVIKWT